MSPNVDMSPINKLNVCNGLAQLGKIVGLSPGLASDSDAAQTVLDLS